MNLSYIKKYFALYLSLNIYLGDNQSLLSLYVTHRNMINDYNMPWMKENIVHPSTFNYWSIQFLSHHTHSVFDNKIFVNVADAVKRQRIQGNIYLQNQHIMLDLLPQCCYLFYLLEHYILLYFILKSLI